MPTSPCCVLNANLSRADNLSNTSFYIRAITGVLSQVDWWLILAVGFLISVGLTTLKCSQVDTSFFNRQLDFFWVGLVALIVAWRVPYFVWTHRKVVPIIYGINLALLLAVMVKGHSALGAQRWLAIGPITLQPSEFAKLAVIFTIAAWLGKRPIKGFFDNLKVIGLLLPPAILVFKQPDLGTSLTFGALFLGMTYWAGATLTDLLVLASPLFSLIANAVNVNYWYVYLIGLGATLLLYWRRRAWSTWVRVLLIVAVIAGNFAAGELRPHFWGQLKDYQQKRLTSFVNPYSDPRGSGYHILQSLIAIGSGGIQGSGLGKGNQSQGAFIPERHTDFIFAVVGEELGFKLTSLIVLAYGIVCMRALQIAYQSRQEPVGSLIAIGVMSMFLFHVFLNIGMVIGIMPVAGVPLPFLSYGGTALIVDLIAIGLLLSVRQLNPPPRTDVWT